MGMVGGVGGIPGTLAEYIAVDSRLVATSHQRLVSAKRPACLPLSFITAYEGLVDRAAIERSQKVLIQGGGGGVGQTAVQLARALGGTVFATESAPKREIVEQAGATFIDFRVESVAASTSHNKHHGRY